MFQMHHAWALVKQTLVEFVDDNGPRLSAALSFYSVLSLAPILVLVLAIAGAIWDTADARAEVVGNVTELVGPRAAEIIHSILDSASLSENSDVVTLTGVIVMVVGATTVFAELQSALNQLWKVEPAEHAVRAFLRRRLVSSAIVFVITLLLMISILITTALTFLTTILQSTVLGGVLLSGVDIVVAMVAFSAMFATIFKLLPRARTSWRHAWLGAMITSAFFLVGKLAIHAYLEHAALESSYGAAGSFVAFLLWLYYSASIFFLGAEFTSVLSRQGIKE